MNNKQIDWVLNWARNNSYKDNIATLNLIRMLNKFKLQNKKKKKDGTCN
jgi:hypothetical protein